ncbi:MAG: hypothetical protein ACM3SR_12080 [Ignavibacteriales bacterium]
MTERELTKLIMDYLKWVPNSSWKKIRGSMGMRDILDIIGCWEGKYIKLEIKTEKGEFREINPSMAYPAVGVPGEGPGHPSGSSRLKYHTRSLRT